MEKTFKIVSVNDEEDNYWLSKTEAERIEAVMILRERLYSLNKDLTKHGKRLLRVYNIVKLSQS
jgi:hypothetical protein